MRDDPLAKIAPSPPRAVEVEERGGQTAWGDKILLMFLVGMVVFLSLWCVWCGVQVLAQVLEYSAGTASTRDRMKNWVIR